MVVLLFEVCLKVLMALMVFTAKNEAGKKMNIFYRGKNSRCCKNNREKDSVLVRVRWRGVFFFFFQMTSPMGSCAISPAWFESRLRHGRAAVKGVQFSRLSEKTLASICPHFTSFLFIFFAWWPPSRWHQRDGGISPLTQGLKGKKKTID